MYALILTGALYKMTTALILSLQMSLRFVRICM